MNLGIGYGDFQIFNGMNDFEDVDKDTIGQFTGYYDCTNKEIYEGDIINYKDELVVCIYSKIYAGFFLSKSRNKSSDYYFLRKDDKRDLKIVGNIVDNPDMITIEPA